MTTQSLPSAFAELSPFITDWALDDTTARMKKRNRSSMDDIQQFYEAMLPRLEAALSYLKAIPYDRNMSAQDACLLKLCLSLAEITTAVEWYNQPGVVDGYDPDKILVTQDLP